MMVMMIVWDYVGDDDDGGDDDGGDTSDAGVDGDNDVGSDVVVLRKF